MATAGEIIVEGLDKTYRRYSGRLNKIRDLIPGLGPAHFTPVTALCDVSFTVPRGQMLGVVGANGSGKSTLLSILANVLSPTAGRVEVSGRVAAMLELGNTFNPHFTGRQNVLFFGAISGIGEEAMRQRLPEVEAMASIGDYIDAPVHTYSTGMRMRLAFSAAMVVDADVLLIDEAMGVGDAQFQRRAWGEIGRLKAAGITILMVTHSLDVISSYCDSAILLDHGRLICHDQPARIIDLYQRRLLGGEPTALSGRTGDCVAEALAQGAGTAQASIPGFTGAPILSCRGEIDIVSIPCGAVAEIHIHTPRLATASEVAVEINTVDGILVFQTDGGRAPECIQRIETDRGAVLRIALRLRLRPGEYFAVATMAGDAILPNPLQLSVRGPLDFDGLADLDVLKTGPRG